MIKKNVIILSGVILMISLIVILSYKFVQEQKRYSRIPPINAVPLNAQIVLEITDFRELIKTLTTNNQIWEGIKNIDAVNEIDAKLSYLNDLIKEISIFKEVLDDGEVIISTHLTGKNNLNFLFIVNIFDVDDENEIWDEIKNLIEEDTEVTKKKYDGVNISTSAFLMNDELNKISFAISDGFLLLSGSQLLVEQAIRQLNSKVSFLHDPTFLKVSESAGKNVMANIYLNYKEIPRLLSAFVKTEYSNSVKDFPDFANWTEFDATVKGNSLLLNGFTCVEDTVNTYLNILRKQQPYECRITEILPSDISGFISLGISDFNLFKTRYSGYLNKQGRLDIYNLEMSKLKETYGIDIENVFYSFLENEMAMVYADINRIDMNAGNFVVFKIKDKYSTERQLIKLLKKHAKINEHDVSDLIKTYHPDQSSSFPIYKMPISNLPSKLFGDIFAQSHPDYFTFIDNYLVFGSSVNTLSAFLQSNAQNKILSEDKTYKEFFNSLETNLYMYINIPKSVNFFVSHLDNKLNKMIENNISVLGKFKALAFQLNNTNDMMYSNLSLLYRHERESNSTTVWESRLDTAMRFKPYFFTNHYTNDKEIFVQDLKNKVYLITDAGRVLWEKKLDGPIIGKISEADFYGNDKLQLLFCTRNKIHLIDRLGNDVDKYPLQLASPSTSGLSVFDYDRNKNYRIFTACEDKKVYAFDIKGNAINGWAFNKTDNIVENPIQFFRIKGKDYIVFADKQKTYIVNRRGNTSVKVKKQIPIAKGVGYELDEIYKGKRNTPRLVTNGSNGEIFYVYLDGTVHSTKIIECSAEHKFLFKDIDNDGYKDYLFVDKNNLMVYNHDKKPIYTYSFEGIISDIPAVYTFPGNIKLTGIVSGRSDIIYLLKSDGSVVNGFPVRGSSPFSVGVLKTGTNVFNLITADSDGFLLSYELSLN